MTTSSFGGIVKTERKIRGWTQQFLADQSKLSQSNISAIERGENETSRYIQNIAEAFEMPIEALMSEKSYQQYKAGGLEGFVVVGGERSGQIPDTDEYVVIAQYDVAGSCGDGSLIGDVFIKGGLVFSRAWLKSQNLPEPELLAVIYAKGESMYPSVEDGQVLLANTQFGELISGKVYLICIDGQLFIKRLINMVTHWVIRSDNPDKNAYPDIQVSKDQLTGIDIQARIVWKAGEM